MGLGFYENMLIVAFAELVAYVLTGLYLIYISIDFFVVRLARKKWILIGFFVIGAMSVLFIFKSDA